MLTVYIASPYSKGDPVVNVRTSLEAADRLASLGYLPFAPLLSHLWHLISPHPYEFWTKMDLEWVQRCDVLLRLPGDSSGADAEVAFAAEHDIPVYHSIQALVEHCPPDKAVADDRDALIGIIKDRCMKLGTERKLLLSALADMVGQHCCAAGRVHFYTGGLSANETAIRLLVERGVMRRSGKGYGFVTGIPQP